MKKIMGLLLTTAVFSFLLTGCSQGKTEEVNSQNISEQQSESEENKIEGTITMNGSTSMEKFVTAISEGFMNKYPDIVVTSEFTGSGAGIEAASNGTADIGNSSRNLKAEEIEKGLVENIVAVDGIGIVTDKHNSVVNVTKQQLIDIYTGKIKNWSELGGTDQNIVVIGREAGSGTRGAFEELLEVEESCVYAQEIDSTGAVMAKVSVTPGSIGYVSIDVIDDSVNQVSIEGVQPTAENIKTGVYFLSRPFVMATKGDITSQNKNVRELFNYIKSDEGQAIIEKVGLIPA